MPYKDPAKYRAYQAAYRAAHREEMRAYLGGYRAEHVEERQAYDRERYLTQGRELRQRNRRNYWRFRDQRRAYGQAYYQRNREQLNKSSAAYRVAHPDKMRAWRNAWKRRNPEAVIAHSLTRYARLRGAPGGRFTVAEWNALKALYGQRCAYCKKRRRLTQDHVIPVSKGGAHTIQNIVPACQRCNSKKGTGVPLIPVQAVLL